MINHYPINTRLFSELDRFVTQAFGQSERNSCEGGECSLAECADDAAAENGESSTANGWKLRLELPGFKKDEVKLSVDEDFLIVTAETTDEARGFLGKVQRRVQTSDEVDTDNIEARLEYGLLYLQIPRRVKAEPKSIVIN